MWSQSYHCRSTSPPWWAMADLTLLANCTASSPSCHFQIKRNKKENSDAWCLSVCAYTEGLLYSSVCSHASARHTHLLVHGWQVPDITDEGPAGHHPQQVVDHAVLGAVPESISKLWVILRKVQKIHRSAVRNCGNAEKIWMRDGVWLTELP